MWGGTRWISHLVPPLVVAMARSWYSVPRRPVMAWVMFQGTTLPTEGKATLTFTPRLWHERSIMYIYRYGDAARTHARYIQRNAHASTHTYIQIIKNLRYLNFSLIHQRSLNKYLHFKAVDVLKKTHTYTYIYTQIYKRHQVNLRITFTWMVLASMHIDGPWRSCFLSVLRYETYV